MPRKQRTAKSYLPKIGSTCNVQQKRIRFVRTGHSFAHGIEGYNHHQTIRHEGTVINTDVLRKWETAWIPRLSEKGTPADEFVRVLVTYLLVTLGPHKIEDSDGKPKQCDSSRLFKIPLHHQLRTDWYSRSGWRIIEL